MPIDYSKFDNIEDSDEEPPAPLQPAVRSSAAAPRAGGGGYPCATTNAPPGAGVRHSKAVPESRGGRELLDGSGLSQKLLLAAPGEHAPAESDSMAAAIHAGPGAGRHQEDRQAPKKTNEPQRISTRVDGKKTQLHTTFPDGSEMVEEFDERTDMLLMRKSRRASTLGQEKEWVYEVGQAPVSAFDPHSDTLRASTSNPIFLRKDTPEQLQWRIRNLTYPANVYTVSVDHEKQDIVVRTSNKKYFKRIDVPDLRRTGLKLKENLLEWKHQHNTLIISYSKPTEVIEAERKALKEAEKTALKV